MYPKKLRGFSNNLPSLLSKSSLAGDETRNSKLTSGAGCRAPLEALFIGGSLFLYKALIILIYSLIATSAIFILIVR